MLSVQPLHRMHPPMKVFSNIERTFLGPRNFVESSFEYLDRSARPEFGRVRRTIEEWYREFPDGSGDLAARFRAPSDVQFGGAAFELYLHELLRRLGCNVTLHPETVSGKGKRPDFLVADQEQQQFYLEATLVTGCSKVEQSSVVLKRKIYHAIEQVNCPNFYLFLDLKGSPKSDPPAGRLRLKLQRWLDSLDPDALIEDGVAPASLPKYAWGHDGWKVVFTAVPRPPERRGSSGARNIGSLMPEAHWVATWKSIRDSVTAKGKLYGKLDKPLVVAVNVGKFCLDRIDEMNALFGHEAYLFSSEEPHRAPRFVRQPNGVWRGPNGVRYRRISAVLVVEDVQPWTVAKSGMTLYPNPWAEHPLSGPLHGLTRALPQPDGQMAWVTGKHPREILGLSEDWPKGP